MTRDRFERLPVHRKLVAIALAVSATALVVAVMGLTLFDVWRYRTRATDDAATLASLIAENSAAAVTFQDSVAAGEILSTVRIRDAVTRACIYLDDGSLFATYQRDPDLACPAGLAGPESLLAAGVSRPIVRNGSIWGTVYVERDFSGLGARVVLAISVAVVMLLLAGALAFVMAQRLSRGVSGPIARLASEARRVGQTGEISVPDIAAGQDELGDLVRAFQSMLSRLRDTNAGLVREIEERRKVEAEREALLERERETSRLKDEFVATVSHELRTPLGAILGWTQVLEMPGLEESTRTRAVSSIARSAHAQARVIEDLVDVSRIAAGKLHLHFEAVDLRAPVEASVEVLRASAHDKGMRLEVELPPRPCMVKGDPDRLRQVVGNLLSNAVKFSEEGARIAVVVRELGSSYEIAVSDEGVGIAPDVLPYIFERYRQADSSTSRRHAGLGLGLAIVREVTELHGGVVTVESAGEGRGATFRVRLPGLIGSALPTVPEEGTQDAEPQRLDGVRVLVVDDNTDALDMLATALRAVGADVIVASSGPEALEIWERESPEVVLCDLAMPGMDGFTVLAKIREQTSRGGRPPAAIAVSAHATTEHRRRSRAAGFVEHVSKPYSIPELVKAVNEALVGAHD